MTIKLKQGGWLEKIIYFLNIGIRIKLYNDNQTRIKVTKDGKKIIDCYNNSQRMADMHNKYVYYTTKPKKQINGATYYMKDGIWSQRRILSRSDIDNHEITMLWV
tara:strand:- start:1401 stop:1715 length:315 start_codon:yes stop_codon:yes gene_type:complete